MLVQAIMGTGKQTQYHHDDVYSMIFSKYILFAVIFVNVYLVACIGAILLFRKEPPTPPSA